MSFFSNIYHILLRPQSALAFLSCREYLWRAFLIMWLVSTLQILNHAGFWLEKNVNIFFLLLGGWGTSFMIWIGMSALLTLTADIFGGQGRISDTLTASGFAMTPLLFLAPIAVFPVLLGKIGFSLQLLATLGLYFWVIVLLVIGLQSAQRFSLDRSIASLAIGCFFFLAIMMGVMMVGLYQLILLGSYFS